MSTRVLRRTQEHVKLLERMVNTTTLTTKRVHHGHIFDIGADLVDSVQNKYEIEKRKAAQDAIASAEARATRELTAALKRLRAELESEREKALLAQKTFYEELADKVAVARDRAEAERIRQLTLKFQKEKEEALKKQWEECERIKVKAIGEACKALRIQLRQEFVLEKEGAIADALKIAREKFRIREQKSIEKTIKRCEKITADEFVRVAKLHHEELHKRDQKYEYLKHKLNHQIRITEKVESDFKALQDDYRRFMDYTFDGMYHSDFLISFRTHGMEGTNKSVSQTVLEDVREL